MMAPVIQQLLPLTGGGQDEVDVVERGDLHLQTRLAKYLTKQNIVMKSRSQIVPSSLLTL